MSNSNKSDKAIKILWAICLIPLILGIIFMGEAETKVEYSIDEYWVAKDYHHVYDKFSGEIVDYIEEDESCEIDGDTIIVTTTNHGLYSTGATLAILFGMGTLGLIWGAIENSEWWGRLTNRS